MMPGLRWSRDGPRLRCSTRRRASPNSRPPAQERSALAANPLGEPITGKKYPKAKHRFALKKPLITAIAGLWREAQGNHPPTFTMLTTAPGPDVAPFHKRQVVVVRPEDWSAWLHLTKPEAELLRPLPEGSLDVATVREGSG
jgi:putative SOS response-associated peptidase YedK